MAIEPQGLPALPDPRDALALQREAALSQWLLARGEPAAHAGERLDLKSVWRALVRRRGTIVGMALLCTLAATAYTLRLTPQYESTVMLQIDRAAQKVVGFNTEVEVEEGPLSEQLQLRTQVELLKSRSLAERVIDQLGLYRDDAGAGSTTSRAAAVARLQQALRVEPVRNSRLVQIQVRDTDPERAADIANATARTFLATHLERKLESSRYARDFLEEQIRQTKARLEESERTLNSYAKQNQILNLGDKGSAATQTFVDFSTALARAEQDRIKAETLYNQVRLDPESAPQAVVNEAIRAYKEQRARLEAEHAKNRSIFKPDYPAMVQARAQIAELDARIKTEVNNILASIRNQYLAAKQAEDQLRAKVASSRSEVLGVQDRSVDMNLLSRELDTNRQVYDSLLQRLKEVSVTASLATNNVSIVDQAAVPLRPSSPKLALNLGLGLMIGVFLGLLAALLREQMDDAVRSASEIENRYRLPLLGLIPFTRAPRGRKEAVALLAHREPGGAFAESYRSTRTALQFGTPEGAPQRFMVTSCGPGEGKSTTALALAINFAQMGQKVLLIDADLRKGGLHKLLKLPNDSGLSSFLSEDLDSAMLIRETPVPHLGLVTAGPVPPDPVELLMGPRLGLLLDQAQALGYQQIVIDGPPLLGISDAIVLGNQIQNIVLAVRAGTTGRDSLKDALRRLRSAGLSPMGVVLTHARDEHASERAYAVYYGHGYGTAGQAPRRHGAPARPPRPGPVALAPDARIEPTLGPSPAPGT